MIDEKFLDVVTPLVRKRLTDLGLKPAIIPVTVTAMPKDIGGVTHFMTVSNTVRVPDFIEMAPEPAPMYFRTDAIKQLHMQEIYDDNVWATSRNGV